MTKSDPYLGVAAVAASVDGRSFALTGGEPARQLGLLDDGEDYEPAADSLPFAGTERRGPGRPKGSINKRSADFRDYILRRYGDPLTGIADLAFRPIADIAAELGCDKLEAAKLWLACRETLLPYVVAKLPAEVAIKSEVLPQLVIGKIEVNAGEGGAAVRVTADGVQAMSIGLSEQYQGLSLDASAKSHDE